MKPLPKSSVLEATIQNRIRRVLEQQGWLVEKTHGNAYQAGWPDLFCFHPDHGPRWVEVKRPGGRLTPAQKKRLPAWHEAGVPLWILTSSENAIEALCGPPNFGEWYETCERK